MVSGKRRLGMAMRRSDGGRVCHLAPLGIPTAIIADNPHLLATAEAAYADWLAAAPIAEPAIELRLASASASPRQVSDAIRVEGSRLVLAAADLSGEADARTSRAHGAAPPRLVGDPAALAEELLDPLLLFLLARMGRTPFHAAGMLVGDLLIALAGPSGAGKSTLALAAAARGLAVLSDDALWVQHSPALRVWGWRRPIHVFPQDAPPGPHPMRRRAGKLKAAVPIPAGGPGFAERAALVVLARGGPLALECVNREEAMAALGPLEPGFDLLPAESAAAARLLAAGGAWRLVLTDDPAAAIDLLRDRLGAPER
jgi:hypothetical protein